MFAQKFTKRKKFELTVHRVPMPIERGKNLPVSICEGERVTKEQMGSSNVSNGVSGSAERFSQ